MSTSKKYVAVVRIDPTGSKPIEPGQEVKGISKELREEYLERGDIREADDDSPQATRRAAQVAPADATDTDEPPIGQDISLYRSKAKAADDEPAPDTTDAGDAGDNPSA